MIKNWTFWITQKIMTVIKKAFLFLRIFKPEK